MVSFRDLASLPASVARYFRFALTDEHPLICGARIQQQGEFWLKDKLIPLTATKHFPLPLSAMVWGAKMRMNPLLRMRDIYVAGQGSMQAKMLSLISVVTERDKAELNADAL